MQLKFLNYDYQLLLKKKINLRPHLSIIEFQKKKTPMWPCALIIPYSNMKLLKTLNNFTTPQNP